MNEQNMKRYGIAAAWMAVAAMIVCPGSGFAAENTMGPRLEVGLGPAGYTIQDSPDWVGKWNASAMGVLSFRLFAGLSVQGGGELGFGRSIGGNDIQPIRYQTCS